MNRRRFLQGLAAGALAIVLRPAAGQRPAHNLAYGTITDGTRTEIASIPVVLYRSSGGPVRGTIRVAECGSEWFIPATSGFIIGRRSA